MIKYMNQASVVITENKSNEIIAYFLDENISVCFRPENPLESYIVVLPYGKDGLKQEMEDDLSRDGWELLMGELD
jgi:hypothetical protein